MTDVVMPQMGESITEGTLTKWLKKKGEQVERDEPLFEISTDKVDTEIPSPVAGTLTEMLVEEGETVVINTIVAKLEESGDGAGVAPETEAKSAPEPAMEPLGETAAAEPVAAPPSAEPLPEVEAVAEPVPPPAAPKGPLSPLVRRMAREHNIDLHLVKGTGAGGRITKRDVEAYLESGPAPPAAAAPPTQAAPAPPKTTTAPPVSAPSEIPTQPAATTAGTRVEAMSTMRAKIAERMVLSKQTAPHVTTVHRCDMTSIARLRDSSKARFKERYGISLTYLSFITRAAAQALRAFPIVNASVDGNNIVYHDEINIGIAVALKNGLIVPVVRNADEKTVVGLQREIADLAQRARARQLKPDEVQKGTFSITNFGSYGSLFGTPIINQPQVAILGCGAVTKEPVVINDAIAIRSTCYLGLTFDHRIIDGAVGDQFIEKMREILENWSEQVL